MPLPAPVTKPFRPLRLAWIWVIAPSRTEVQRFSRYFDPPASCHATWGDGAYSEAGTDARRLWRLKKTVDGLDRRLSVAPMMARTDRHCRYLLRLISARTLLYSEMIHANAVVRGDSTRLLAFDEAEHPVASSSAARSLMRSPARRKSARPSATTRSTSISAARARGSARAASAPRSWRLPIWWRTARAR